MVQAPLFDDHMPDGDTALPRRATGKLTGIVNVAQVPKRSPFRYPGGKTWCVPAVRRWFASMATRPALMIEPFVGGGIIALTVAFERLADHVIMAELDDDVASVWETLTCGDAEWLAERIITFKLTGENVVGTLSATPGDRRERAFQTILRNRVQRGGIMARGAGLIKHGENGRGLGSRWYASTLRTRILDIARGRDRLTFVHGDGMEVMRRYAHRPDAVYFIDPPYTVSDKSAGKRLYAHSQLDHEELFRLTASCAGDVLMTYDDAPELHGLAARFGLDTELIPMKSTHHAEMTELIIGRNLDWARPRV